METKQALEIISQILDAASKSGLFSNLDSAIAAANAFQIIKNNIKQD